MTKHRSYVLTLSARDGTAVPAGLQRAIASLPDFEADGRGFVCTGGLGRAREVARAVETVFSSVRADVVSVERRRPEVARMKRL